MRDSLSALFLAVGVIAVLALIPLLHKARIDLALLTAGFACVLGGHMLGRRAFVRLEAHRFEPLLDLVILCAGAASIIAGASAL